MRANLPTTGKGRCPFRYSFLAVAIATALVRPRCRDPGSLEHGPDCPSALGRPGAGIDLRRPDLSGELELILLAGALDADLSVREAALSGLRGRQHPELAARAAAQLNDSDPHVRLLGVDYLKFSPAEHGLRLAAGLLDDADPRVAGRAIKLMEEWSAQDFGMQRADTVEVSDPVTGLKGFRAKGVERTRAAGERARDWWTQHATGFQPREIMVPQAVLASNTGSLFCPENRTTAPILPRASEVENPDAG